MPSYLTYVNTEQFRKKLIARNLKPYTVPGAYSPPGGPVTYETVLRDIGVFDSPDDLIRLDPFADVLYRLNAYGPTGGFNKNINAGGLANTKSNLGPYDVMDAKLPVLGLPTAKQIPTFNKYSTNVVQLESIGYIQQTPTFSIYGNPTSFLASSYTPYQILYNDNPTGTNGPLSQDSSLAQIGAKQLKQSFRDTIAKNIEKSTLGRINLDNAFNDPFSALRLLQGKKEIIENNWTITRPGNLLVRTVDFGARLAGTYYPGSPIPGDYFRATQNQQPNQFALAFKNGKNPVSTVLGTIFGGRKSSKINPSELFLQNTGSGQRSQLFYNLDYNKYRPQYSRGVLTNVINNIISNQDTQGNYYIGNRNQDPSRYDSPIGQLPFNEYDQEVEAIVLGPTEQSKAFEGTGFVNFGLAGSSFSDEGGIAGGLVWNSSGATKPLPGYRAKVGGDQGSFDEEYFQVSGEIGLGDSSKQPFKTGTLLDFTQRLINSAPGGYNRLFHVGNAISNVSKVFNDGYKEITKGSKVLKYGPAITDVQGIEYCRLWTKDTPHYTWRDLMKTEGNFRKFSYSVLDNTYNLNIAPLRNPGSTNIIDGKVKKYMFSLENLAWRTSNRPGLSYDDLPVCERGPNGGRIMWFPPYDLKFNESSTASFQSKEFLGRLEPIYTYKSGERTGQLTWTIIVDHPSILNLVVDKVLKNESRETVDNIVDAFFAGCKKYDPYELAKRYNTIPLKDLYTYQTIINGGSDPEVFQNVINEVTQVVVQQPPTPDNQIKEFQGYSFYFDNDIPIPDGTATRGTSAYNQSPVNYLTTYNTYTSPSTKQRYSNSRVTQDEKARTASFFSDVVEFNFTKGQEWVKNVTDFLSKNATSKVSITLQGSASAPQSETYNKSLSKRRIDSVKKYFDTTALKNYITEGRLIIAESAEGEGLKDIQYPKFKSTTQQTMNPITCTTTLTGENSIYSVNAMACRAVFVKDIKVISTPTNENATPVVTQSFTQRVIENVKPGTPPTIDVQRKLREGVGKKILRSLLTECDYFELIKETNPFFYDSIKDKLKYFSPAFHSMTPEGLNSRLTFLQQCMRPGDTIPIIGPDGKPKYNSSVNTAFGVPPVLVLRVGDFFHTKIIPTNLSLNYEQLDLNPEGIGVQPMLAKVTLSFKMTGGMGLKEPVQKLQNALSFNYYANTEMWDERADATEDTSAIDQEIIQNLSDSVAIPNPAQPQQNAGGTTIGVVQTTNSVTTTSGQTFFETGTTSYRLIMDSLVDEGQGYINTVINKLEQVSKDYNDGVLSLFTANRLYNKGFLLDFTSPQEIKFFGKPQDIQTNIDTLFSDVINDIKTEQFDFIEEMVSRKYQKKVIEQVKANMIEYITNYKSNYSTGLSSIIQEITNQEQKLINVFSKLDFVSTLSDGFIKPNSDIQIYNLSGTSDVVSGSTYANTLFELTGDYTLAGTQLDDFMDFLISNSVVSTSFTPTNITSVSLQGAQQDEKRFYLLMSSVILDKNKLQGFKDVVLKNGLTQVNNPTSLEALFDNSFGVDRYNAYTKEKERNVKNFTSLKATPEYKNYQVFTPYTKGKTRLFSYSTETAGTDIQKTRLRNIYSNVNTNNNNNIFNGKKTL
jgi:outer membrane protein OmpA-like peptidoglycan-associated protein